MQIRIINVVTGAGYLFSLILSKFVIERNDDSVNLKFSGLVVT